MQPDFVMIYTVNKIPHISSASSAHHGSGWDAKSKPQKAYPVTTYAKKQGILPESFV
jgi:hypothetical protein